jgi:hypothetical protein
VCRWTFSLQRDGGGRDVPALYPRLKALSPVLYYPSPLIAHRPPQVGLTEKVNVQAGQLSGGQKRKLSVCIALGG